jgi:hypothetical protein
LNEEPTLLVQLHILADGIIAFHEVMFPQLHCFNGNATRGALLFAKHCTENGRRQVHLEFCICHPLLLQGRVQIMSDGEPNQNCLSPSCQPPATEPNIASNNDD